MLAAVVCALAVVVAVFAPRLTPAATAIAPGIGIEIDDPDGDAKACTLGFLATDAGGRHYALTAGHCDRGGAVAMSYRIKGNLRTIGRFAHTVHEGRWGRDIAAIRLDDDELRRDTRILGERAVTGVAKHLYAEDTLCFDGISSGLQCGAISMALHAGPLRRDMQDRVLLTATAKPGDSGSPVYRLERDGSATAVGIVNGNVGDTGVVATMVRPYLEQWGLTLDTVNP